MLLETEKENVCINQLVGHKRDEIIVEGDVIVNDIKPEVLLVQMQYHVYIKKKWWMEK